MQVLEQAALDRRGLHIERVSGQFLEPCIKAFFQRQFLRLGRQMEKELPITVQLHFCLQIGAGGTQGRVLLDATDGIAGDIHHTARILFKCRGVQNDQGVQFNGVQGHGLKGQRPAIEQCAFIAPAIINQCGVGAGSYMVFH